MDIKIQEHMQRVLKRVRQYSVSQASILKIHLVIVTMLKAILISGVIKILITFFLHKPFLDFIYY